MNLRHHQPNRNQHSSSSNHNNNKMLSKSLWVITVARFIKIIKHQFWVLRRRRRKNKLGIKCKSIWIIGGRWVSRIIWREWHLGLRRKILMGIYSTSWVSLKVRKNNWDKQNSLFSLSTRNQNKQSQTT